MALGIDGECPLPKRRSLQNQKVDVSTDNSTEIVSISIPPSVKASKDSSQNLIGSSPFPTRASLRQQPSSVSSAREEFEWPEDAISTSRSNDKSAMQRLKQDLSGVKMGRAGALAGVTLTATALAVPLVGFASPLSDSSSDEKVVGAFGAEDTWSGTESSDQTLTEASGLQAVETAASRAKLRTPIEVSTCLATDTAANGSREITQKAQLYWPLQEGTYSQTSDFGWRISPVSGEMLLHEGVDLAAPAGTPIYSAAEGEVTEVDYNSRSGGYAVIKHQTASGEVFYTAYLHQYSEDIIVKVGDKVSAGQQIGAVGNAGWSTGAHLHFEVRDSADKPTDPITWMQQQGAVFLGEDC